MTAGPVPCGLNTELWGAGQCFSDYFVNYHGQRGVVSPLWWLQTLLYPRHGSPSPLCDPSTLDVPVLGLFTSWSSFQLTNFARLFIVGEELGKEGCVSAPRGRDCPAPTAGDRNCSNTTPLNGAVGRRKQENKRNSSTWRMPAGSGRSR